MRLRQPLTNRLAALSSALVMNHFRAVGLGVGNFIGRCVMRHDDRRLSTKNLGSQRYPLCVISR